MVQIVPRIPSALEKFMGTVGETAGTSLSQQLSKEMQVSEKQEEMQKRKKALMQMGLDPAIANLPPEAQAAYFKQAFTPEKGMTPYQQAQIDKLRGVKSPQEDLRDQKTYDVIKKNFGEKAADLYEAAPTGGKTDILGRLLEMRERGMDVENLLSQYEPLNISTEETPKLTAEREKKPIIKAIDYDKGLTPKERVARQEGRYAKNLPLYQESIKKIEGLEAERDSLETLEELSPKIGTLQRLNINPSSGELFIPGIASPEAQRYVKTVNDFTTKAKDTYGARVTNFELDRFLKRLPTLANSEEGRRQIIRQMKIINEINEIREKSLQEIIDEHGGIRNIDYDRAEKLAKTHAKSQIEPLRKEFKNIENASQKSYENRIEENKKIVPKGSVAVETADGMTGFVPKENLKNFLKDNPGAKPL